MNCVHELCTGQNMSNFRQKDIGKIRQFFESSGLPLPQKKRGHYYETSDGGLLTALPDYSCLIRLTLANRVNRSGHHRLLQPLFRVEAGDWTIDLNPGVDCPVSAKVADLATHNFKYKYGITITDGHRHNFGRLPGTDELVIIDAIEAQVIPQNAGKHVEEPNLQENMYGRARALFREAWRKGAPHAGSTAIQKAWDEVVNLRDSGMLVASWENIDENKASPTIKDLQYASDCYTDYRYGQANGEVCARRHHALA